MAQAVIVREYKPGDLGSITAIQADAVENGYGSFSYDPLNEEEMNNKVTGLNNSGLTCFVADAGGTVAGYCYAAPFRPRPGYRWTLENSVYVDRNFRGLGIGRQLLDRLIANCTDLGYRQMIAMIGDSSNKASVSLHKACGFSMTGILDNVGYKHGSWLDVVIMQRRLGEGSTTPPEKN